MKRIFSLTLALCLLLACFTACAKQDDSTTAPVGDLTDAAVQDDSRSPEGKISLEEAKHIYQQKAEKHQNSEYPIAVIVMENGDTMVLELYPDMAENTVNNFAYLANQGFYDGLIFHRCIQSFMIQGGDPLGTGMGGPGYTIEGEFANNGHTENTLSHTTGVISMARRGSQYDPASFYNTAGSQFFICVADNASVKNLDKDYAAFGKVIEGLDTAGKIVKQPTDSNDKPLEDQKMLYVRVATYDMTISEPVTIAE